MENAITNYSFTVIEDNMVPLSASFETVSVAPIIIAVVTVALLVAACIYVAWFASHKTHILSLTGKKPDARLGYYFVHPKEFLRMEYEIENNLVNKYIA